MPNFRENHNTSNKDTDPVFVIRKPNIFCADDRTPVIGRHIFRKYDIITDQASVNRIKAKGKMLVPLTSESKIVKVPLKKYLTELIDYEKSVQRNKNYCCRYLHTLETVLDRSCTEEQAKQLMITIAGVYGLNQGTYFARLYERKGCKYACLYMSDRVYYKTPVEFTVLYSTDWYVDSKTRKRINDAAAGGILLHKAGDVRTVEMRHFSNKSGIFKMGPRELRAMSYKVLKTIRDFYDEYGIGHHTYLLPRFDYSRFRGNKRDHLKTINSMYRIMEDVLNSSAEHFNKQQLDGFEYSFQQIVHNIRSSIDRFSCVIRKNVTVGTNRIFKLSINYARRFTSIVYNMEIYVDHFMSQVKNAIDSVYANYGVTPLKTWETTFKALRLPDYRKEFSYRTYVWNPDRIPQDRQLTAAQRYFVLQKMNRNLS